MRPTFRILSLALLCGLPLASAFAAKPGGGGGANQAPTVVLTAPVAGSSYGAGASVMLQASASDSDGKVSKVEFFRNGTLIGRDTRAPFNATWSNASAGNYTLTAVATDDGNASTVSTAVAISVATATCNTLPATPSGLTSPTQTTSSVALQWNASAPGPNCTVSYRVLRDGGDLASTAATSYTANALLPDTAYSFAVIATNQFGGSPASAPISVRTAAERSGEPKRVVGYFTQWGIYTQGYTSKTLDTRGTAAQLTHLVYAFGNVRNNRCELGVLEPASETTGAGGDAYADYSRTYSASESVDGVADVWGQPLRGHWNQLRKLKAKYPNLKVMISLGGWTWSRGFASAARPENRAAFVASCVDAYVRGNLPLFDAAGGQGAAAGVFDGIDIDWEYPAACGLTCGGSEDRTNFTEMLAEFRRQFDAVRPGLVLSVAVGAGIDKIRVIDPGLYQAHVDHINVMSYDFHGGWEPRTNFHSALFPSPNDPSTGDVAQYNIHDAIQALLDRGVPASKLNLGLASYGRGWSGVPNTNLGLYQSGSAANGSLGAGIESYRVLKAMNRPSYTDPHSLARWTYDGNSFWSFDTPESIADKMNYVRVQGLGGAFLWDFSGDDDTAGLMDAVWQGLQ